MKMTIRFITLIVVLASVLVPASAVSAQGPGPPSPRLAPARPHRVPSRRAVARRPYGGR